MREFSFEKGVYYAKVKLEQASSLHIPGRDGVMLDGGMPVGESWHIDYPTDLNAQFILAETKDGWLRVGTKYRPLHFTQVNISKLAQGFEVALEWRPWSGYSKPSPPKLLIEEFGSMDEAIEDYKSWMERVFKLKKKEENPDLPQWVFNTRLVLFVDMWAADGIILADYADVVHLIEDLEKLRAPEDTILFLAGWSWTWDARYPEYTPAEPLGGAQGFREMVRAAKDAGYRIMPNMNALGLDYALPEFRRMWRHQVTDREGNKLGWPGTFPGAATHAFAYMRPCARAWREHLVNKVVEFVTEYDLDAAYLDQTLVAIDDPRCNFENGMRRLVGEVRKRLPNVLIGGEGCHERIVGSVPFFQMHGAPWSNTALGLPYEKDSSIFTKLFGDYGIFCGHLSIPVPFPGRQVGLLAAGPFWDKWWAGDEGYRIAQEHYDRRGAIKTLRLNLKDFGLDEETRRVIQAIKTRR